MIDTLVKQSTRKDGKLKPSNDLIEYLAENYPELAGRPVPEQTYLAVHGTHMALCSGGNPKFFLSFNKGYRPTCGNKGCPCMKTAARSAGRSELNKRSAAKFRERTGLDSPSQLPGVGERISAGGRKIGKARSAKIQATMVERYGVNTYLRMDGVHESGVAAAWSAESKERRADTNTASYGSENPLQNADIRGRIAETNTARYGFANPMKNPVVAERSTTTYHANRGTDKIAAMLNDSAWWSAFDDVGNIRAAIAEYADYDYGHVGKMIKKNRPDLIKDARGVGPMEYVVRTMLDNMGVKYVTGDRTILSPKEIDVLCHEHGIGIEVNGLYWHSEGAMGRGSRYHIGKSEAAEACGVRLIQFWDTEVIQRPALVESIIRAACGKAERIAARKTRVISVPVAKEREFLETNHIQGYVASSYAYGLEHDGELVAMMTFGPSRYGTAHEWELLRYCNAMGKTVLGGAQKMFKYRPGGSLISYCDRRLFGGGIYRALGFTHAGNTRPGYRYTRDYKTTESRIKYQKHKLPGLLSTYDPELTEWENMRLAGYDRVWDCGHGVWTMD